MDELRVAISAVASLLRSAGLVEEVRGPEDVAIRGVSQDSRSVAPGDLFLTWKGAELDGHDFVAEAARAGAVAAVVERALPDVDVAQIVVSDGRLAAALAADAVFGSPWKTLFTAAVTGTNGKTTTALITRHLLSAIGAAAAIGTLGLIEADGSVRSGTEGLTTPGPARVSAWLRELKDGGVASATLEASSHALKQRRLDGLRFDAAVFTNLSQDHLDYHDDLDDYLRAKARLVRLLKEGGTVVVNADHGDWEGLDPLAHPVWTFGATKRARVRADAVTLGRAGVTFTLDVAGDRAPVRLPLLGRHNVENALAAAAVAGLAGRSAAEMAAGLASLPQVTGRLEAVLSDPFSVLIDFAHSPDALNGALSALRPLTRGRLIVVFGAGGDRDRTKRRAMAQAVGRHADLVVLTSDNPRTEDPERILDDLAVGLAGVKHERFVDRRAAIRSALGKAHAGDTVLLAGKGHERYQIVGDEKRPFDEREVVRDYLAETGVA